MARTGLSNFAASLRPSTIHWYQRGKERNPYVFSGIFREMSQSEHVHREQMVVGMNTLLATADGSPTTFDEVHQAWKTDYVPTNFRSGAYITSNLIDDGKGLNIAELVSTGLGYAWMDVKNRVSANLLARAFTAGFEGSDGVTLCSTAHPYGGGGTYSNRHSTDADLSELALEQLILVMHDIRDDRGLHVPIRSKGLIVCPADQFEAERILNSTKQVYSSDNTANAILNTGKFSEGFRVIDYLDSDDDAYFIHTDQKEQGLTLSVRKELEVTSDVDFPTDSVLIKGHGRVVANYTNPLHVFGSAGS
jgi:hypothetical protein